MLLLSCWLAPAKLRCDRPASSCSWASPLCSPPPCCRLLWSPNSWIWCHYINIQYSVLFTGWERRCPPPDEILGRLHYNCSLLMTILKIMMSRSITDLVESFCWVMSLYFIFSMLWYEFMHVPFHPMMGKSVNIFSIVLYTILYIDAVHWNRSKSYFLHM